MRDLGYKFRWTRILLGGATFLALWAVSAHGQPKNCKGWAAYLGTKYDAQYTWLFPIRPELMGQHHWVLANHDIRLDRKVLGDVILETVRVTQGNGMLPTGLYRDGDSLSMKFDWPVHPPRPPRKKRDYVLHTLMPFPFGGGLMELPQWDPAYDNWDRARGFEDENYPKLPMMLIHPDAYEGWEPHAYGPKSIYRSEFDPNDTRLFTEPTRNWGDHAAWNNRMNEQGLLVIDEIREASAAFALKHEERRRWPKEFLQQLGELSKEHWDATYIAVRQKNADGEPGEPMGTMRLMSSGPDTRLMGYPELLREFLQGKKGKWAHELVDSRLTRPLLVEEVLKTKVPRPVLHLDEPLTLPNGETITFIVGEAIEVGALAIRKDVNPKTFKLITEELFRQVFDENYSSDYNLNGKLFYAFGDASGVRLHGRMGWETLDVNHPFTLNNEPWWIIRHTSTSLQHWITGLSKHPNFSQAAVDELRVLFDSLSNPLSSNHQRR